MPGIPVKTCVKMVSEVAKQCAAPTPAPTPAPNFDALAASLAAQANAIASQSSWLTFGGVIFAVMAIVAGLGWGYLVKGWAERTAKDAVREWMDANAPGEIAKVYSAITPPRIDGGGDPMTQEEQEAGLGGEAA